MKLLIVDDEQLAREDLTYVLQDCLPQAEILAAGNKTDALALCQSNPIDIAFLDVEMPDISGLELSKELRSIRQDINIIFTTAYSQYALPAFKLYASAYLMKPVCREDILEALENLRFPCVTEEKKLRVQCFGNFEVFYDGQPLLFRRSKAKELLAYLISLHGSSATGSEVCAVLWEDSGTPEKQKIYLRQLISELRSTLETCGMEDVLIHNRNSYAVNPKKLDCDLYRALEQESNATVSHRGEFMKQYSWAEFWIKEK